MHNRTGRARYLARPLKKALAALVFIILTADGLLASDIAHPSAQSLPSSQAAQPIGTVLDLPPNFINEQILGNLAEPDSLEFSPDGRIFISERVTGKLRVATYNVTTDTWQLKPEPFYIFDVPKDEDGNPAGHRSAGLRNITFDPDFAQNGYIYAFYMPNHDRHNRVVRIKANAENPNVADVDFGEELVLRLPFNDQISTGSHNGGAIAFGNDGKLYITTGDGWEGDYPGDPVQSLSTFTGKVLRINGDGTIPADNPFYADTADNHRAIFALGLRNPYTLSKHPETGVLYINEARGDKKDQVYIVEAGANYQHEGSNSGIGVDRAPWATAADAGGQLITGGAWYPSSGGSFPAAYAGVYFTPLWGGNEEPKGTISYIASNSEPTVALFEENVGVTTSSGLAVKPVMTQIGPDGNLYYLLTTYITEEGTVQRIRLTDQETLQPPTLSPAGGRYQTPLTVTINSMTPGAEIHYTLDGSQPLLASPVYTAPLSIDGNSIIKAVAFRTGMNPSSVASEAYDFQQVQNIPPMVDAGIDETVEVGSTVTLNGSGSTDPDGDDDLLFGELWTQLSGPPVTILDKSEEVAYFVPSQPGTYTFQLEINDGQAVGHDQVTFTAVNTPTAAATPTSATAPTSAAATPTQTPAPATPTPFAESTTTATPNSHTPAAPTRQPVATPAAPSSGSPMPTPANGTLPTVAATVTHTPAPTDAVTLTPSTATLPTPEREVEPTAAPTVSSTSPAQVPTDASPTANAPSQHRQPAPTPELATDVGEFAIDERSSQMWLYLPLLSNE